MNTALTMTTRLLLSSFVLNSIISSPALAEQNLVAAPAPKAAANARAAASTSGDAPSSERATYVSMSLTSVPAYSMEPLLANVEFGRRLGENGGGLHLLAGRFLGLSAYGISAYQARAGFEGRGGSSTVRVYGGVDLGVLMGFSASDSDAAVLAFPRFGFEIGDRVWFRGTLEIPVSFENADDVIGDVMLGLGVGAEL